MVPKSHPITVAHAAPATPIAGKPKAPVIKIGSSTQLVPAKVSETIKVLRASPWARMAPFMPMVISKSGRPAAVIWI